MMSFASLCAPLSLVEIPAISPEVCLEHNDLVFEGTSLEVLAHDVLRYIC